MLLSLVKTCDKWRIVDTVGTVVMETLFDDYNTAQQVMYALERFYHKGRTEALKKVERNLLKLLS